MTEPAKPQSYFIAAIPDSGIAERTKAISREFKDRFAASASFRNIPNISVSGIFRIAPALLPQVRFALRGRLAEYTAFASELSGFDGFDEHTIFIRVMNQKPFVELGRAISALLKLRIGRSPGFMATPHLTVAYRDLSSENYRLAISEFRKREFHAVMQIASLCLMHQDRGWKLIEEFPLAGKRDYTPRQMDLFVAP